MIIKKEEIAKQIEQVDNNKMIEESGIVSTFDEIHMNE